MSEKRVLVVPRDSGLSEKDRAELSEAGIIVVTVNKPHDVKLLSTEPFPASSNDLLRAAVHGLTSSGSLHKSTAWDSLMKAVMANKEPKP